MYADQPQPYALGGPVVIALKVLKGELTALVAGTQVVADAARDRALLSLATVRWLLTGTAVVYALMAVLLLDLARRWRRLPRRLFAAAVGCAVWIAAYDVLLHSWFWPTAPEYHMSTLPPLIVLVLLGSIAARRAGARRWRLGAATALLALVGLVNVWAAIAPWYRYGHFRESVAAGQLIAFRPGDFFVSTESGLDAVLGGGRHLAVKDVLARLSKAAGFAAIDEAIAERLARGQRVFIYNFVPWDFTLLGLNHAAGRRGDPPLTRLDFEAFMAALSQRHELAPAAEYWEGGRPPSTCSGSAPRRCGRSAPGAAPARRLGGRSRRGRDAPDPGSHLLVTTSPGGGPKHVFDLVSHLPRDEFEVVVAAPETVSSSSACRSWGWRCGGAAAEPPRRAPPAAGRAPHRPARDRRRPHPRQGPGT